MLGKLWRNAGPPISSHYIYNSSKIYFYTSSVGAVVFSQQTTRKCAVEIEIDKKKDAASNEGK